jgi:predicted Rossmann-fold nucleotide-binding protein
MGKLLARAGFDVMTGGYRGVMEAASRGAHAAGAQVTGVTLERFRDRVNPYVIKEIRTISFYDRFAWLVDRADGYIAMHGGIGTLAEVTFAWQELLLDMVPPRPLILVGERWRRTFKAFRNTLIGPRGMYRPITIVATPEEALEQLLAHFPQLAALPQSA